MEVKSNRIKERSTTETVLKIIHDYAYFETIIILAMYLGLGYLINPDDVCIINSEVSYILILLAVITLFHGFENGILAVGILATAMWLFYPAFDYVEFLVALMMTMIYSEFHHYWTKKIKESETNSNYRGAKLDELSKAFYSLKISHDQLEKNYVIKPMSIRNSIEYIIDKHEEIDDNKDITDRNNAYYLNFLGLLEKSFNVHSAVIVYKQEGSDDKLLDRNSANVVFSSNSDNETIDDIFDDYLVDKAISRHTTIYISDQDGEPALMQDYSSAYIVVIPMIQEKKVIGALMIKKMPFMAFNRENLTSISILLEYFAIEIRNKDLLHASDEIKIIPNEAFRFEYTRLKLLFSKYQVDSIILVLRINNELQAMRVYEKIVKMLRSLDMVAVANEGDYYYITLLFPLHDKAAALGYLNRLLGSLDEKKDKKFNYMTFNMSQTELLNKYLREDYAK